MKYLLVLAVLAIAISLWRSKHREPPPAARRQPPAPQDMVACARCGMHLPHTEALPQGRQFYCCADHRDPAPR